MCTFANEFWTKIFNMIYYSILLPLLLAMSLSLYIIPRILVVSVRKELYDEATQERRGRKKRNVPRLAIGLYFYVGRFL